MHLLLTNNFCVNFISNLPLGRWNNWNWTWCLSVRPFNVFYSRSYCRFNCRNFRFKWFGYLPLDVFLPQWLLLYFMDIYLSHGNQLVLSWISLLFTLLFWHSGSVLDKNFETGVSQLDILMKTHLSDQIDSKVFVAYSTFHPLSVLLTSLESMDSLIPLRKVFIMHACTFYALNKMV